MFSVSFSGFPIRQISAFRSSEAVPEYTDMPLSGGAVAPGYHEEKGGYLLLERPEYVRSASYEPLSTPFSYQQLRTERQRSLYDSIYEGCYCLTDSPSTDSEGLYDLRPIPLDSMDYTFMEVEEAFAAVLDDHPEIFWMSLDFDIYDDNRRKKSEIVLHTDYTADEIVSMMEDLNDSLKEFYSSFPPGLSPYERELYIYSAIIDRCTYDYGVEDDEYGDTHPRSYNLCGVMVDRNAVCEGYARTFDYLCSDVGVETVCVMGVENGDEEALHMWNAVMLDGEWYQCDVTWDDYDDDFDAFLYLNINEATMSVDHTADKTYAELSDDEYLELTAYVNTFIPSPCTATDYSYYLRESVMMDSVSVEKLSEGMYNAAQQRKNTLMVYVDPDVYTLDEAAELLFDDSQPYYEALDDANRRLQGAHFISPMGGSYYDYEERNLLVFELDYLW